MLDNLTDEKTFNKKVLTKKQYTDKLESTGKALLPFDIIEINNLSMGQGTNRFWLFNNTESNQVLSTPTNKIYFCIQILEETTFTSLLDRPLYRDLEDDYFDLAGNTGPFNNKPISAGTVLYGWFKNITIDAGIVCAYEVLI